MSITTERHDLDAWFGATDRQIAVLPERVIRIADALQVRERGRLITARHGEGKAES
jgi:hypothetical protein